MKNVEKHLVGWLSICLLLCSFPVWAQGDAGDYLTIVGMVKDKQNKKALENVNVSVHGSNIGTVTNAEGEFALKIKKTEAPRELEISHIGYVNNHISLEKETPSKLTVWLTPHANLLNEVVVFAENPRMIVEKAISKIPLNYSDKRDMLTGFYRETVQKGRRYIGISEAVIDVSKTAYTNRNTNYDKVRVVKGRRLLSQKASDTLAVKVVGGPNLSITLDVVKNKGALLDMEELNNYEFWMAESMLIDNRMQYVINFRPKVILMYALLYGKLYTYKNDPEKRVDSRYIHRGKFDWKLADGRKRKGTVQKELFDGIGKLRSIRSKEKVFDASANVWTLDTWENGILGVVRELEGEQMTALFNFAEEDRTAWIEEEGEYMDLYTGKKVSLQAIKMEGHSFVLAKKC